MAPLSSSSASSDSDSDADLTPQTTPLTNQPNHHPEASTAADDSTEEDDDDEEVEESTDDDDEEEEEEEPVNRTPIQPAPSGPESDETESDGSDSEPAQLVAPISSKPMDEPMDEPKKQLFQRVFTLEDEIAILKSLAEYQEMKGPMRVHAASIPDFRAFLGKSLNNEVNASKLYDKIRRFKSRFDRRRKKDGGGKFNKEHDRVVYELSKKVWGDFEVEERSKKRKKGAAVEEKEGKKRTKVEVKVAKRGGEFRFLNEQVGTMGMEGMMDGVDKARAREVDKETKRFRLIEMKSEAERMGLLKESYELIIEGLRRSAV